MKARDLVAVAALRSALAAIENAEASDLIGDPQQVATSEYVAGSTVGLGATDVTRRVLRDSDVHAIVQAQVAERSVAAEKYDELGRPDHAGRLRAEADVLRQYSGPSR